VDWFLANVLHPHLDQAKLALRFFVQIAVADPLHPARHLGDGELVGVVADLLTYLDGRWFAGFRIRFFASLVASLA
jgi:hypothetical protein